MNTDGLDQLQWLFFRHIETEENVEEIPEWAHSHCPDHWLVFGSQWTVESPPVEDCGR